MFLTAYNLAWAMAIPFLACSARLRQGWKDRLCISAKAKGADVWIQAASAGEAYLASQLAHKCIEERKLSLFVTSSTAQGLEIFRNSALGRGPLSRDCVAGSGYFPFDMPLIAGKALAAISPLVLVVMETELWPGLFAESKRRGIPVIVLNGRLSERSLRGHLRLARFWRQHGPARILAVSSTDASRFATLFPNSSVDIMKNMKFDRIQFDLRHPREPVFEFAIAEGSPFIVMGSIRKEEEADILETITTLLDKRPDAVVALFPRHMHRIRHWTRMLGSAGVSFELRSKIGKRIVPAPRVILWDVFGELIQAYSVADAVFVGGTLRPCGGQNFLEPLASGIVPCIGPYWDNFVWIGREIVQQGLVKEVRNSKELATALLHAIDQGRDRQETVDRAAVYIRQRQGGTEQAWEEIKRWVFKQRGGMKNSI